VPGVAHGVSGTGCVPRLIEQFVREGKADALDEACLEKERRPAFVVGMAGPRA
jgi:hypothetical protein